LIALYVHWPFCASKCPYCDFNSHVPDGGLGAIDQRRWKEALLGAMARAAAAAPGRTLGSVFFGGGTPSSMDPGTVAALLEAAAGHWPFAADIEITLESNPGTSDAARLADFRGAGVNRLSLGVQALDDASLEALGRGHSAADARAAIAAAANAFDRFSFDLIYARPGQGPGDWRAELRHALTFRPTHLSCYQLSIEPGTAFFRDRVAAATEDLGADLYRLTQELLGGAGLPAYEVSNHAAPGAECRHNLHVWSGGDYIGVGPGAHGRMGVSSAHGRMDETDGGAVATYHVHDPGRWLAMIEAGGDGIGGTRILSAAERFEERVMTGLRLAGGIGAELHGGLAPAAVVSLLEEGFLAFDGGRLKTTPGGRLCLDAVLAHLLAA